MTRYFSNSMKLGQNFKVSLYDASLCVPCKPHCCPVVLQKLNENKHICDVLWNNTTRVLNFKYLGKPMLLCIVTVNTASKSEMVTYDHFQSFSICTQVYMKKLEEA